MYAKVWPVFGVHFWIGAPVYLEEHANCSQAAVVA